MAIAANVQMAWWRGGENYLCIQLRDTTEKNKAWILYGPPRDWGPITIQEWLEQNSWKVAQRPTPPCFRGFLPGAAEQTNFSYELECHGQCRNLSIRKWEKHRKEATKLTVPNGGSLTLLRMIIPTVKFDAEVAATVKDTEDDEMGGGGTKRDSESGQDAAAEPLQKKPKGASRAKGPYDGLKPKRPPAVPAGGIPGFGGGTPAAGAARHLCSQRETALRKQWRSW